MKVLVVDDNMIVRMGLRRVLEQVRDVEEVEEAADGVEAIEVARSFEPDIVLLDVRMPRMGGLEALPTLAGHASVIMMTSADDAETIAAAMESGAKGYLIHARLGVEEVAGAIAACRGGGMVLGPGVGDKLSLQAASVSTKSEPRANLLAERLTEREAEVLEAAARGMSNQDIAAEQFLSARTVKNYINSAYVKLGVHSRAEAILLWKEAEGS
ncbi:two component transcriptional regulator, LuxR family [Actinomyces ruminicola]|uniref:Two component transcriptional regulator, LuxR family n=1 Tax=Actinomyces ruminicola TaxID=332524 RepID=A0A1H0AAR5_9ACTO|nr:response regulator transcription factor [Actinomyces ruminicola]SDN29786.1 two component transcriptional regulator, LuxR family [Actinomyces ruminicola]